MTNANHEVRAEIGRQRREKTRRRLITAAAKVIVSRGEEHATIDDFIQAAGLSRGTFYNYYSTREEIIEELWATIGKDPFRQIANACDRIEDPAEQLIIFARLVLDRAARDETWGWLIYAMSGDEVTVNEDLRSFPTPELDAGMNKKRFKIDNIEGARDYVVCLVRRAIRANLSRQPLAENYNSEICRLLLVGLGVSQAEAYRLANAPLPALETSAQHEVRGDSAPPNRRGGISI